MSLRRNFRVALLGLGLAAGFPSATRAADEPAKEPPKERPAGEARPGMFDPAAMLDRVHSAVADMKLSDEQKTKIEAAFSKAKKELDDLKADPKGETRERFQAGAKVMGELREAVRGTLTDDQRKELEQKLPLLGRGAGAVGGMRQAMQKLDLTDEQKAKIEAVTKEGREKMQALIQEHRDDPSAVRDKIRPLYEEMQKKVEDVLTPEQKEKLKKLREEQGGGESSGGRTAEPPAKEAK